MGIARLPQRGGGKGVTTTEELEIQLERIIGRIDADARDNGHLPHA